MFTVSHGRTDGSRNIVREARNSSEANIPGGAEPERDEFEGTEYYNVTEKTDRIVKTCVTLII